LFRLCNLAGPPLGRPCGPECQPPPASDSGWVHGSHRALIARVPGTRPIGGRGLWFGPDKAVSCFRAKRNRFVSLSQPEFAKKLSALATPAGNLATVIVRQIGARFASEAVKIGASEINDHAVPSYRSDILRAARSCTMHCHESACHNTVAPPLGRLMSTAPAPLIARHFACGIRATPALV
jgi:hypothetical protein